jgi:hypothetical protein
MKSYFKKFFSIISQEGLIWLSGLIFLALIKVDSSSHFTFCPFKNIGIDFCPGCGLGKSIHYLLHLQIEQSLNAHPLGLFAFAILVHRIYDLLSSSLSSLKIYFSTNREKKYDQSFTTNA